MIIIFVVIAIVLIMGIMEWENHKKNIEALPIRVNVNGIRGKSTVTRLTTAIIKEAGYKTIGKTTGTSARMIYWDSDEEEPIIRRAEGPNISEQKRVVKSSVERGAESLVSECMAVNPDYQITFQEKLLQANIGVIVNVLEDHMDVMGPTLDDVADAFKATIPYDGHLVITEGPYAEMYKKEAKKRNSKVIIADNRKIKESFLKQFDYMVFPDNASLALGVAEALGIPEETAFRGMLKAHPDPGAMRIHHLDKSSYFVNGFAANDAASTINIWHRLEELGYPTDHSIVIMNCRADRVDRTIQFANDVLPRLSADILVVIGASPGPIINAVNSGQLKVDQLHDWTEKTTEQIYSHLIQITDHHLIYGIGNIHGAAEPLIEEIQQHQEK